VLDEGEKMGTQGYRRVKKRMELKSDWFKRKRNRIMRIIWIYTNL
jgi:hypothetical protein